MRHLPLYIIITSIAFALLFRVVLPWAQVFQDGVQFNTVDAYVMVRFADTFANFGSIDYFMYYPEGASRIIVFPAVIAIFSKIIGVSNNVGAALLPPLLFLLTLIPVYIIGRVLFNRWVAIGTVVLFCLLPGEILNRTMLGAADYHCWEIFLVANIMMLVILAAYYYKNKIDLFFYSVGALGLMVIYWYSWSGSLWLVFILAVCLTIWVFLNTKSPVLLSMFLFGGLGIVAGVYFISPEAANRYISLGISVFTVNIAETTTEYMSLFFSFGKFDLNTSWLYFGITFYLVLIGLGWLLYRYVKDRKPVDLVFLVWTVVALGMMISKRRFDYYFAINAAIIASFVLVSVSIYFMKYKASMVKIIVVLMIAVCLPLIRSDYSISTMDTYMPKDWRGATQYLRQFSDEKAYATGSKMDFGVFSLWDYGYWILEESHLSVYSMGSVGGEGRILLSTDMEKAVVRLRTLNMRFVVVDDDMLKDKWYPLTNGKDIIKEDTFVYRLCNSGKVDGLTLVYAEGKVKVYEVVKGGEEVND